MKSILITLLLAVTLLVTSCSTNQVLASLEAVTNTASLALPLLSSQFGLDVESLPKIRSYLTLVNRATIAAANILEDRTLNPTQKSFAITALFSRIAQPELPTGTPKDALALIESVSQSISMLLASVNPNPVAQSSNLSNFANGWGNSFAKTPKRKPNELTKEEISKAREKLKRVRAKARKSLEVLR